MKFIMGFLKLEWIRRLWRRSHISLRRDKRLPHGVRSMQTPTLQRCRSSSQKIFAGQIFFGSPVFILVRTAMRLCSHSHISLRYNASLLYPVRPCRGLFCRWFTEGFRSLSVQTCRTFRVHGTLAEEFYSSSVCRLSHRSASAVCFRPACVCRY